jgi:hypothetical protein
MAIYILIYIIFGILAFLQPNNLGGINPLKWSAPWKLALGVLTMFIGFRDRIGGDWFSYLEQTDRIAWMTFVDVLGEKEVGFAILLWVGLFFGYGIYLTNLLSAIIFVYCLLLFCRDQKKPFLALLVALPYLVIVVGMGYTRQSIAIGFTLVGISFLLTGRPISFGFCLLIASFFHRSSIVLLPVLIITYSKGRWLSRFGVISLLVWVSLFFYLDTFNNYFKNYVQSDYQSAGAVVRVVLIMIPSLLYICFRRRFQFSPLVNRFWTIVASASLLLVIALVAFPSSTAIDRIALYLIPIQLVVLSNVPIAFSMNGATRLILTFAVVIYSGSIMFGWLMTADNAESWVPFKSVIF